MESECANCGHDESDHKWSEEHKNTVCEGDGYFDDGDPGIQDPQCDCDLFEEEEEVEGD